MKDIKSLGKSVAVVVIGVMAAGMIMNAFRTNGLVKNSISGYDA